MFGQLVTQRRLSPDFAAVVDTVDVGVVVEDLGPCRDLAAQEVGFRKAERSLAVINAGVDVGE